MKEQQIHAYIGGLRDDFILEAQPKALAALTDAPSAMIPPPVKGQEAPRKRVRRWFPLAVAAAILLTVGVSYGTCAGVVSVLTQSGVVSVSGSSAMGNFLGGLFPFLSPDGTEPPFEVTLRDPDETAEPPETTAPEDISETEPAVDGSCAQGHKWVVTNSPSATACYTDEVIHLACTQCGQTENTAEGGHYYLDGYCQVCHLIEGAFEGLYVGVTDRNGQVEGFVSGHNGLPEGSDLILPNVYYHEEHGLVPVTEVRLIDLHRLPVTRVVIPEGFRTIAKGAMDDSQTVTEIILPDSLESIGAGAFQNNSVLKTVRMSRGVKSIGQEAFKNCVALTDIELPDSLESLGTSCFYDCDSLISIRVGGSLTELPARTFMRCDALESVELSDSVTVLGTAAFYYCPKLTELNIPSALTVIGSEAFMGSGALKLTFPSTVTEVGSGAFENSGVVEAHFTSTGTGEITWGESIFSGCKKLEAVTLPNGLTKLPASTFSQCKSLRELYIPDGVTTLEDGALQSCAALIRLRLPAELSRIGVDALLTKSPLAELTMPDGGEVYYVQDGCLIERATRTLVLGSSAAVIPADGSVSVIGDCAFYGRSFTHLVIPEGVTHIGAQAFYATSLRTVELPSSLTVIGEQAFTGSHLTEVTVPEGCTTLQSLCFGLCESLEKITLPSTLNDIGYYAFFGSNKLTEIHFNGTADRWRELAFMPPIADAFRIPFRAYCTDGTVEPSEYPV